MPYSVRSLMRSLRRYPPLKLLRRHGLQKTYEGTKVVKDLKLQRLTTSFEEIKKEKDESFNEFYAKLTDIVNSAFNLGETILDAMPRSLLLRNQRILTRFL